MPETINKLVQEALQQLHVSSENTRKSDIEDRLDYYYDNYKHLIDSELSDQFVSQNYDNINLMIDDSINLVKYVIDEISTVYHKPAERKLDNESDAKEGKNQRYFNIINKIKLDLIMDKSNKLTNVCNEVALVAQPRNGIVEVDLMTPDMFSVIQNKDDPKKIDAFIYEVDLTDSESSMGVVLISGRNTTLDRHFVYYDVIGNHFKFDINYHIISNPENPDNENPFKDSEGNYIIPAVICHKSYLENAVFDTTSGNGLFSATKQIGVIASLFNYYLKNASHKQPVITGSADVKIPDNQILDPLTVLKIIGENANFDLKDFQGDLEQFNQQIENKAERILNQEGLSLADFKKSAVPESGFKLELKREPLQKKRDEQIKFWRIYENDLFIIMRIVNNTMYPSDKISETAIFSVNFQELVAKVSPEEQRKNDEYRLSKNMVNILDLMIRDDPDLNEESAREKYENNKKINDELNANTAIETNLDNKFQQINNEGATQGATS